IVPGVPQGAPGPARGGAGSPPPQQITRPACVTTQVCSASASICTAPSTPGTKVGVARALKTRVPSPSWPASLLPQQATRPDGRITQLCRAPAAIMRLGPGAFEGARAPEAFGMVACGAAV